MAQEQELNTEDMSMPGINGGPVPQTPLPDDENPLPGYLPMHSRLHELVNEHWGYGRLDPLALLGLIQYADPDMAEQERTGFSLKLKNGSGIHWTQPTERNPNERIFCSEKEFNEEAAATIVSMARLRGWRKLNLTGNVQQKEMLWLETQRQNLKEYERYLEMDARGLLPKGEDGNPMPFEPLTVTNFTPLETSPVYQQWLQEVEAWKLAHLPTPGVKEGSPDDKMETPEPEKKAEEPTPETAQTTEPEKKPEEKKTITWDEAQKISDDIQSKKKPEPEKKEKNNLKSKFVKAAGKKSSKFIPGPGTKPHNKAHKTVKNQHKPRNKTHGPK